MTQDQSKVNPRTRQRVPCVLTATLLLGLIPSITSAQPPESVEAGVVTPLGPLWRPSQITRRRVSSWKRSGENGDNVEIAAGETFVAADVKGSGRITRIWMTNRNQDPDYLKNVRLRFTFDGVTTVDDVPLGMFFATGPWRVNDISGPVVNVMRSGRQSDEKAVGRGSLNMLLEMPYTTGFKVEIKNEGPESCRQFFYIDYEAFDHGEPPLLFHATHHRSDPTTRVAARANKNPRDNYTLLDVDGYQGAYIGTVLCVESHPDRPGKWYEGDDMFVIDREPWPPRLHGTGTEDYFGMAWGFHRPYQGYDHGVSHYEKNITDHDRYFDGRYVAYRWHLVDPIQFKVALHASIEAGHGNDCRQYYESVAFWYGRANETKKPR